MAVSQYMLKNVHTYFKRRQDLEIRSIECLKIEVANNNWVTFTDHQIPMSVTLMV